SGGVCCLLAVLPSHRGGGIGTELLRRGEAYLRGRGARDVFAGPMAPLNPFTFGIYGGSRSPGFLESDAGIGPFLERRGYRVADTVLVLQRHLDRPFNVIDGRLPAPRQRFEGRQQPPPRPPRRRRGGARWPGEAGRGGGGGEACRGGERGAAGPAVGAVVWEMAPFSCRWNEHAVGFLEVEVDEPFRRQGLARLLMGNVMRCYHDQYFTLVEAQA